MDLGPSRPDRRWIEVFTDRCQLLVGCVRDGRRADLAADVRHLAYDIPAPLHVRERIMMHALVGNVLGNTARITGIAQFPEVASAFVLWAATDPTRDSLNADVSQIAGCCAAALERFGNTERGTPHVDPRVARVLLILQARFADHALTLTDVAGESSLSISHATRLLKEQTGFGFRAHVHRRRIEASCRLLRDTALSVKEISAAVGYGSSSQLGRHFRRLMGTTPHSYRRKLAA
jgi:AraC-like DNA-binding protein